MDIVDDSEKKNCQKENPIYPFHLAPPIIKLKLLRFN